MGATEEVLEHILRYGLPKSEGQASELIEQLHSEPQAQASELIEQLHSEPQAKEEEKAHSSGRSRT